MSIDILGLFGNGGVGTAALIASIGWVGAYYLTGLREDKNRRIKATADHSADQLKNFYAPLVSLTDQLNSLANVKDSIKKNNPESIADSSYYSDYFLPIHKEINEILSTNMHLLEGSDIPKSFTTYFEHYAAEKAVYDLISKGVNISGHIEVPGYPGEFYWDVRRGFQEVLNRYEAAIKTTRTGPSAKVSN